MQLINLLTNAFLVVSFLGVASADVVTDCNNRATPCVIMTSKQNGQCQAAYKDPSKLDFKTQVVGNVWYYAFQDNSPIVFSCEGSREGTFTEVTFKDGFGTATKAPNGASYTWVWRSGQQSLTSTVKNDAVLVTQK